MNIEVGDTMRWSVELLEQIDQMPERRTLIVRVVKIEQYEDGHKQAWLQRVQPEEPQ